MKDTRAVVRNDESDILAETFRSYCENMNEKLLEELPVFLQSQDSSDLKAYCANLDCFLEVISTLDLQPEVKEKMRHAIQDAFMKVIREIIRFLRFELSNDDKDNGADIFILNNKDRDWDCEIERVMAVFQNQASAWKTCFLEKARQSEKCMLGTFLSDFALKLILASNREKEISHEKMKTTDFAEAVRHYRKAGKFFSRAFKAHELAFSMGNSQSAIFLAVFDLSKGEEKEALSKAKKHLVFLNPDEQSVFLNKLEDKLLQEEKCTEEALDFYLDHFIMTLSERIEKFNPDNTQHEIILKKMLEKINSDQYKEIYSLVFLRNLGNVMSRILIEWKGKSAIIEIAEEIKKKANEFRREGCSVNHLFSSDKTGNRNGGEFLSDTFREIRPSPGSGNPY